MSRSLGWDFSLHADPYFREDLPDCSCGETLESEREQEVGRCQQCQKTQEEEEDHE